MKAGHIQMGPTHSLDAAPPIGKPDPADVEWLRAAMSAGSGTALRDDVSTGTVDPAPRSATGDAVSLGDRILGSLRGTASSLSESWQQANDRSNALGQKPSVDGDYMKDLLKLQSNLVNVAVNLDVLSKAVGKCAYTVDSLCRN